MDMKKAEEKQASIFNANKVKAIDIGEGDDDGASPAYYSRRIAKLDPSVGSGIHEFVPPEKRLAVHQEEVIGEEDGD